MSKTPLPDVHKATLLWYAQNMDTVPSYLEENRIDLLLKQLYAIVGKQADASKLAVDHTTETTEEKQQQVMSDEPTRFLDPQ